MNKRIELLAPAGNLVCLHAAVRAGANAVYVGLDRFNARRGADNFTLDTLKDACAWAHVRGVRVFLTVNTVVLPTEIMSALTLVGNAWAAGVDAFIVQDIGLAVEIGKQIPEAEVHISTQMNTHNTAGIQAAAALGASRVTLARELALSEITHLCSVAHDAGMQVEVFAHGALCVCYSGQCFMSSLVGGRSANRGVCAQACRLPYELHNVAVNKPLEAPGEHLLSPKDLSTIDLLPQLVAAGVDSLKIEGRMKSPEYVFATVSTYRAVLDRVELEQGSGTRSSFYATPDERQRLAEAFSRGFTQAYLVGDRGNSMMSYGRPNNRGVFVGRVVSAQNGVVELDSELPLVEGDAIEFWTNKGHFTHTLADLEPGKRVRIRHVEKPVGKGDRVFRVRSAQAAFKDNTQDPCIPVTGEIFLQLGKPARLVLATLEGPASADVEGPVVEAARTKAVDEFEVREHIDRFGNTPFVLSDLTMHLDDGVGLGFSTLHKLRANAADVLQQVMLAPWGKRTPALPKQDVLPSRAFQPLVRPDIEICVWATNASCARAARKAGADTLFVPALNYKRGEALIAGQRSATVEQAGYPKQAILAIPTVDKDSVNAQSQTLDASTPPTFDPWMYAKPGKPVFADSLGAVFRALTEGRQVEVGPHVPVTNSLTARYFADAGVARIWLSPELTLGQIQRIAEGVDVSLGLFVSGAAELMITEHCVLMSQGPCNQDCETCARRLSPHYLKDRKGFEMPVVTDCCGRSHVFNAVPLDVCHLVPDLVGAGISAFMVDTTLLNSAQTSEATARAVRARDLYVRTGDAIGKREGATTGHLFRGVS